MSRGRQGASWRLLAAATLLLSLATSWPAAAKTGPAAGAAGSGSPLLATVDVGLEVDQVLDVGTDVAGVELALEAPRSWTYLADLAHFAEDAKWRLEVDSQELLDSCLEPRAGPKTRVRGYQHSEGGKKAVETALSVDVSTLCVLPSWGNQLTGLFVTADPLGYVDGPSMYAFAGFDPVNNRDPLGLEWWNPLSWFDDDDDEEDPNTVQVGPAPRRPIYVTVRPVKRSEDWTDEEVTRQLDEADRILSREAGVNINAERYEGPIGQERPVIEVDLLADSDLTLTEAEELVDLLEDRRTKGDPLEIHYIERIREDREPDVGNKIGGTATRPSHPKDQERAAVVARDFRNGYALDDEGKTTAHELGHAIGGLCDWYFVPRACPGPSPGPGSIMSYPAGDELSEEEAERMREFAQEIEDR